ncbi:MAG: hypothetical protein PHR25_02660 [Clostridia bacterium]|nr:hypothetical protein [Clostridia bacterium]MDD4375661.1 hypothetical protein [Clostridia bacterium]
MIVYIALGLVAFSLLGIIGLFIYFQSVKNKYKKNSALFQKDQMVVGKKTSISDITDRIYQAFYIISVSTPVLKYYARRTRLKLEMVNDYTEYEIRRKTGNIMLSSVIFVFAGLFIFLNVTNDLYMQLITIIAVVIVNEMMINFRVGGVADKILRQLPEVFTEIRHSFHEHGMIEEAFNDAIDELEDKEIMPQVRRIKEAITSEDPEVQLERYYDTAPNRFLKLFAGVSYLTMELGDRKVDGTSVYLKNLNNIVNDVYLEVLKRDKINYMFRSLTAIAVAPILFTNIIQNWAESNFSALINFYSSSFGFIIKSLILVSIFICYYLLRLIREDSEQIKFDRIVTKKWQERAYQIPIVRRIVDGLIPAEYTTKRKKQTEMIKNTNAFLTLEWLYVNKVTAAVVAFVATLILILNMHYIDFNGVFNQISEEFLKLGKLSEADEQAAKMMAEEDAEYVNMYRGDSKITKEQIKTDIEAKGNTISDEQIERIYNKVQSVQGIYLKFWELLIALFVGFIVYFMPNLLLFMRNKMREMEKENEIMQFQSIILMLMYIERIDVQTMLEWLERYSYAFKDAIATALNNYEAGATEALEELKDRIPNKDFKRIVEGLISSVERIPIREAFDELETERTFYYEKRKEGNERLVQKKVSMGKAIGFTPMIILIAGYFVGPLMLVSIMQMSTYFTQMRGM